MPRLPCLTLLLLAACGQSGVNNNSNDASPDIVCTTCAQDLSVDLTVPMFDPARLCTTPACATAPCTAGCVFHPTNAAPCADPSFVLVNTSTVLACSGFCGKFDRNIFQGGTGCSLYNGNLPGCEVCGSRWGAPSCYEVTPAADYLHGGAICGGNYTCFDGRPIADMDPGCSNKDMFPPKG